MNYTDCYLRKIHYINSLCVWMTQITFIVFAEHFTVHYTVIEELRYMKCQGSCQVMFDFLSSIRVIYICMQIIAIVV